MDFQKDLLLLSQTLEVLKQASCRLSFSVLWYGSWEDSSRWTLSISVTCYTNVTC